MRQSTEFLGTKLVATGLIRTKAEVSGQAWCGEFPQAKVGREEVRDVLSTRKNQRDGGAARHMYLAASRDPVF